MAHGKGGKASREAGAAAIRDARLEPRNARAGGGSMPDSVAKRRWAPYVAAAIWWDSDRAGSGLPRGFLTLAFAVVRATVIIHHVAVKDMMRGTGTFGGRELQGE